MVDLFALALGLVGVVGLTGAIHAEIAVAIALVSTALGTLLPILKDNGQLETKLGSAVLKYGAFGELCPGIAMALLLSLDPRADLIAGMWMILTLRVGAEACSLCRSARLFHNVSSVAPSRLGG